MSDHKLTVEELRVWLDRKTSPHGHGASPMQPLAAHEVESVTGGFVARRSRLVVDASADGEAERRALCAASGHDWRLSESGAPIASFEWCARCGKIGDRR